MNSIATVFHSGSRGLSLFLGVLILGLAATVAATGHSVDGLAQWVLKMFGVSFLVLLTVLVLTVCFCWVRMVEARHRQSDRRVWSEAASHAANGTATLALTYTLLGISLGIGTLADQELNTETVQVIIRGLTEHFSLAFMTTVVGLPVSAVLRALVAITEAKLTAAEAAGNLTVSYFQGDNS